MYYVWNKYPVRTTGFDELEYDDKTSESCIGCAKIWFYEVRQSPETGEFRLMCTNCGALNQAIRPAEGYKPVAIEHTVMPVGKHRGVMLCDIDVKYLQWAAHSLSHPVVHEIRLLLDKYAGR